MHEAAEDILKILLILPGPSMDGGSPFGKPPRRTDNLNLARAILQGLYKNNNFY